MDRRSRKIQKLAEFIYASLSGTMTHELNQPLRNMALENSSPDGSSPYTEGRRKKSNLPLFKLGFGAQQKPMETQVLND